jgi:hypothetical protein
MSTSKKTSGEGKKLATTVLGKALLLNAESLKPARLSPEVFFEKPTRVMRKTNPVAGGRRLLAHKCMSSDVANVIPGPLAKIPGIWKEVK